MNNKWNAGFIYAPYQPLYTSNSIVDVVINWEHVIVQYFQNFFIVGRINDHYIVGYDDHNMVIIDTVIRGIIMPVNFQEYVHEKWHQYETY